jgi:hypothetical protein
MSGNGMVRPYSCPASNQSYTAFLQASLRECKWREDFFSLSPNLRFRRLEMKIEKLKVQMTTQLAELGKETDAINQLKKTSGDPNDGTTAQA